MEDLKNLDIYKRLGWDAETIAQYESHLDRNLLVYIL